MTACTAAKLQEELQKLPSQPAVDLKSLHLERMRREQEKREEKKQQKQQSMRQEPDPNASKSQSVKKPKGTSKGNSKIKAGATDIAAAALPDDDFDSLINAVVKADSICGFVKCKATV